MSEYLPLEWQRFAEDSDTSHAIKLTEELKEKLESAIEERERSIEKLREFRDEINKSCYRAHASKTAGSTAGLVGGAICVAGAVLMPFTGGLSALALIPGGILGASGGVVSVGADIGHFVHAKVIKADAEKQLKKEQKQLEEIISLGERINKKIDILAARHSSVGRDCICFVIWKCVKDGVMFAFKSYKVIDTCLDVYRVAVATQKTTRSGISAGQALAKSAKTLGPSVVAGRYIETAYKYAKYGGRIGQLFQGTYKFVKPLTGTLGVVLVGLDIIAIPIDFFLMVQSSINVHRYRNGQVISDAARKLEGVIEGLKDTKSDLQNQLDSLSNSESENDYESESESDYESESESDYESESD